MNHDRTMINQDYQFTKTESSRGSIYGPMPDSQLHAKITHTLIKRINYPRHLASAKAITRKASLEAKSRPMLTEQEEMDIAQTVAFVLVATGAMERQTLTRSDWKEIFREVRGADCLRIDRRSKNKSEIVSVDSMTDEALAIISVKHGLSPDALSVVARKIIARKIRYERACITAAFRADTSRKRKANYRTKMAFLRWVSTYLIHRSGNSISDIINSKAGFEDGDAQLHTLNKARNEYRKYWEIGEAILTGEAMAGIAPRTLKSFADICTGKGLLEI